MTKLSIVIASKDRLSSLKLVIENLTDNLINFQECIEIIVVDDSGTQLIPVDQFGSSARVLYNDKSVGLLQSRLTGAENAHGTFVWFIDDDDIVDLAILQNIFEEIEKDPVLIFGVPNLRHLKVQGTLVDFLVQGYTPPNSFSIFHRSTLLQAFCHAPLVHTGIDHHQWFALLPCTNNKVIALRTSKTKRVKSVGLENTLTGNITVREGKLSNSMSTWIDSYSEWLPKHFFTYLAKQYYFHNRQKILFYGLKYDFATLKDQRQHYSAKIYFLVILRYLRIRFLGNGATFETYNDK